MSFSLLERVRVDVDVEVDLEVVWELKLKLDLEVDILGWDGWIYIQCWVSSAIVQIVVIYSYIYPYIREYLGRCSCCCYT